MRRVLTAHRFHPTGPAVTQVLLLQQESREGRKRVAQLEKDTKELQRSEAAARAAAVESELLHTDALRVAEQLEVTRTTPLTPSPRLQLHPAAPRCRAPYLQRGAVGIRDAIQARRAPVDGAGVAGGNERRRM